MKPTIKITVLGGVADVDESTIPPGVTVEIHDFDNEEGMPPGETYEPAIYRKRREEENA